LENPNIGTIFTGEKSPNVNYYLFILNEKAINQCRQGIYCYTVSEEGMLIGKIEKITVINEYFEKPSFVKNFDNGDNYAIQKFFPSEKWEDYIAYVDVVGVFPFKGDSAIHSNELAYEERLKRPSFPAKPGCKIFILENQRLWDLLGFEHDGIALGRLEHYEFNAKVNLHRLINKHFAVLAMSGAGKSYLISVLLEELLLRDEQLGTPGIILIDVHGEYKFLSDQFIPENKKFASKTKYYDAKYFQIGVSTLNAYNFANYEPKISKAQIRELKKIIDILKNRTNHEGDEKGYDLAELIQELENTNEINKKVRDTLIGWLFDLSRLNLFYRTSNPPLRKFVSPGHLTILDLSNIISIKKKQIIISYLAEKLFYLRRVNKIPPFLMILEEAHQFVPEGTIDSLSISKKIIETIAREGRKFYAQICLISQRPVRLSSTVLSQCNTHIIMRITNPNDLDHIKSSSEALNRESLRLITTLPAGDALIMGAAVNIPVFIHVRKRFTSNPYEFDRLEDVCRQFIS